MSEFQILCLCFLITMGALVMSFMAGILVRIGVLGYQFLDAIIAAPARRDPCP